MNEFPVLNNENAKKMEALREEVEDSFISPNPRKALKAGTAQFEGLSPVPTDLSLIQKGNTTQSYSLSQNGVTVGGCNVSVTQQ